MAQRLIRAYYMVGKEVLRVTASVTLVNAVSAATKRMLLNDEITEVFIVDNRFNIDVEEQWSIRLNRSSKNAMRMVWAQDVVFEEAVPNTSRIPAAAVAASTVH